MTVIKVVDHPAVSLHTEVKPGTDPEAQVGTNSDVGSAGCCSYDAQLREHRLELEVMVT